MGRNVINAESPSLYGQPQVSFRPNDFDAVIWTHGYDIICEKAIRCPCQGNSDSPLPSCQNCHGSGYIYINPYRTNITKPFRPTMCIKYLRLMLLWKHFYYQGCRITLRGFTQ